jgi:hypothetical protein
MINDEIKTKFWERVRRGDGCWEWTGTVLNTGYGQLGFFRNGKRTNHAAHRLSYEINKGPIPRGLFVCHHCDNPRCVRPEHLFLGTAKDNSQDMVAKGRAARPFLGKKRPEVSRDRHYSKTKPWALARGDRHSSKTHPERIARGDRHGTRTHPERFERGSARYNAKLDESSVADIKRRAALGESDSSLAREFNVSRMAIWFIRTGNRWKHVDIPIQAGAVIGDQG